ncbi:MAG: hypothetical protein Q9163_001916 [Psora crenata]
MVYGPNFRSIAPDLRTRVYHYLVTTTAARLPWRSAIRYAKFGFPISLMLVNQLINRETTEFIVSMNTFHMIVGHQIVPDTVISPLPYGRYPTPPNFAWIQYLHLTIEIDLDHSFASANPDKFLPPKEGETIFDRMQTLSGLIRTMGMPSLRSIALSIYEIIHPKNRIHISCDINEREVRERYAEIIGPLWDLDLPDGLSVHNVDIVYGDGYTLEGADPERWRRADDYIMLLMGVLDDFGCYEGRDAALGTLVKSVRYLLNKRSDVEMLALMGRRNSAAPPDGRLTAKQVFSEMTPIHPPEVPPILPPPAPVLPPIPPPPPPVLLPQSNIMPPANTLSKDRREKRPGSLRRYWNEGTKFVAQPRKDMGDKKSPQSPQSSHSAPSADLQDHPQGHPKKGGSSGGRGSLGRYWEEGTAYTLQSFVDFSRGRRGSSSSKGKRWSIL